MHFAESATKHQLKLIPAQLSIDHAVMFELGLNVTNFAIPYHTPLAEQQKSPQKQIYFPRNAANLPELH
jgi:hypothetical protein